MSPEPVKESQLHALVVGKTIEGLRLKRGWNQQDFAARVRLPQYTLSRIEAGKASVDLFALQRIASELGLTIDQLQSKVDEALRVAKEAATTVQPATKSGNWWAFLGMMGLMGVVVFAVAAVIDKLPDGPKPPGPKPGPKR